MKRQFAPSVDEATAAAMARFFDRLTDGMAFECGSAKFWEAIPQLADIVGAKRMMEIGGGRSPSFSQAEIAAMGAEYTVNDISEAELRRAPAFVSRAHFDIATRQTGQLAPFLESYDLIFSHMVFEHVKDVRQAYRNIHALLRPGGICLNYHPILFATPFILNKLLPETFAHRLLRFFFSRRNDDDIPKFPATYDLGWISPGVRRVFSSLGFRNVWQVPCYGHHYYRSIPGLAQMTNWTTKIAQNKDFTPLATFCFTVVQK